MKTDMHKDWTDAFRESFPEEARPAAGGWEAVAGRLRRAAARRRAAVAAATLALPLAGGIFFLPNRSDTGSPEIAVVNTPSAIPDHDNPATAHDVLPLSADTPAAGRELKKSLSGQATAQNGHAVLKDAIIEHESPRSDPPVNKNTAVGHEGTEEVSTHVIGEATDLPDLFAETTETPARKRRLAIGLGGAATAGGTPTTVTAGNFSAELSTKSSNNFWSNNSMNVFQHEYFHDLPLGFGITASYGITDRIWLESGLEYTRLHSRLDDIHTFMHFAGIPLRANYRFCSAGPLDLYTGAGVKAEKCLKATLGGLKVPEKGLQWSGSVLLGAQVRLTRGTRLYLQPDLAYYFTKTTLMSYRTENRLSFSINAGLRFDIQ